MMHTVDALPRLPSDRFVEMEEQRKKNEAAEELAAMATSGMPSVVDTGDGSIPPPGSAAFRRVYSMQKQVDMQAIVGSKIEV